MHDSEINKILISFVPVGLKEMDDVMLMNRQETKYIFSARRLAELLDILAGSYKVLEIEAIRSFPYHTTYLDTPDMFFYTQQVRGKLNRHKIRYRRYESTGNSFLEIKKKTNKNRTVKWRIRNSLIPGCFDNDASIFIRDYLPYDLPDLKPVLINGFNRITLVGIETRERITLDYDITFKAPEGADIGLPFLAIAEIKREKNSGFSPASTAMKNFGISPNRFSKYCMGNAIVREMLRKNTLKRNLLLIKKIENEYIKSS
jgi:hypothetical protein